MDINDILNNLTEDDIDKLKKTAQQFFGGTEKNSEVKPVNESFIPDIDANVISTVAKITGEMNKTDARCEFVAALKPFLSAEKVQKADEAIKLLKFLRVVETMKGKFI